MANHPTPLIAVGSGENTGITRNLRELAELINKYSASVRFEGRASDGGPSNIGLVNSGVADIGVTHPDLVRDAFEGSGDFNGKPHENLRHLTTIGMGAQILYTLANSPISSLSDLKGKRIIMQGGTGTGVMGRLMLKAAGIDPDKEAYCERMPGDKATVALRDGSFDAIFVFVFIPANYKRLLGDGKDIKLIPIDQQIIDRIAEQHGKFYMSYNFDGSELGLSSRVLCLAMPVVLVIRKQVPPDAAYEVLKILYEHSSEMTGGFRTVKPQDGLLGCTISPHLGAEKYYREKGIFS